MGNEMGNNNSAGLQEEENANPEGQENSLHEPVSNGVKGENNIIPATESKDYHQKDTGLDSDDRKLAGDDPGQNQTSDETVPAEPEVQPSVESPKAEMEFKETSGQDGEIQPAASLQKEFEDQENLISSNLEEKVFEISNDQIEKQSFLNKGEEDRATPISVAISSAHDPELQDSAELKSDQLEMAEVLTDQSEQARSNSLGGIEDISESNITRDSKENGDMLDSYISDKIEDTDVSGASVEAQQNERLEAEVRVENGNDLSKAKLESSDLVEVDSGEIAGKMNCKGTNYLESQLEEVSVPEDKCTVLVQETKLIGNDSENADINHNDNELEQELEVDRENAYQTELSTGPNCHDNGKEGLLTTARTAASNGSCHVEEVEVLEESDNQNRASRECREKSDEKIMKFDELGLLSIKSSISNGKINKDGFGDYKPEAHVPPDTASKRSCQDEESRSVEQSENQNEASDEHFEELGKFADESPIANRKQNEDESGDCKPEADLAHGAVTNGNYQVEEVKAVAASENQINASEMVPEFGIIPAELTIINGESNEEESEVSKAKEEEPAKKQSGDMKENIEAPGATRVDIDDDTTSGGEFLTQPLSLTAEEHLPCLPVSLLESEDHRQETGIKSANDEHSNESTLEPKPENSNDFLAATASSFQVTSSAVELLDSEVELAVEKYVEEGSSSSGVTRATEMVTEADSSASEYYFSEKLEKNETSITAKDGIEAQENAKGLDTVLIPEKKIQAEVPNSPGSTTESTISAAQLRDEKATEAQSSNPFSEQNVARGDYTRQDSAGRFSNESIPDYLTVHSEMRKSPSFDLDLRIEARSTEESDQKPLLYQDKNTIEGMSLSSQADITLQSTFPQPQESPKYQEMPVEERVIRLERSDSEKSKTPFLGFLKEDEEANHVIVTPKKQNKQAHPAKKDINKEVTSMPSKSKEKMKRRPSLFANCMCCTTVIN